MISLQIADSIDKIDAQEWNSLSAELPFQSHAWYAFGERVMKDCKPVYLLAYQDKKLIARGSFWATPNEPLPQYAGAWRVILKPILRRWPLLICRSPLSYATGIILPEDTVARKEVIALLVDAALAHGRERGCSFLLFDYLGKDIKYILPKNLWSMEMPGPGTVMRNIWQDFDNYLAHGNKKDRQHYKRTVREAKKLDIEIRRHVHAKSIDEILPLVRNVEAQHGAPVNPWTIDMVQNMEMIKGTFLTATMNDQLVGCGLLLEDNNAQMAGALGLSKDVPYVYLMLIYEGIKVALENKVGLLRWGSGAYDVKRRLGFELEDNSVSAFMPIHPFFQKISKWYNELTGNKQP